MKITASQTLSKLLVSALVIGLSTISVFSLQEVTADCADQNTYGYEEEECAPVVVFSDANSHEYQTSIAYAQRNRIVEGYDDQTFRPNNPINRAEFVKILVEAVLGATPSVPTAQCFSDVIIDIWYSKYVCHGKGTLFDGYPDGEFKAANNINIAEAAKILANAFNLTIPTEITGEPWYGRYIQAIANANALPVTITKADHLITRAEMVEMIMRLKENITNSSSLTSCDLVSSRCEGNDQFAGFADDELAELNVDMKRVRQTWLDWYNQERSALGLHNYSYNNQLNRSAFIWSDFSMDRGELSHKRIGQTAYYDYGMINNWFAELGLFFENVNRVTHSENIGYGPFNCTESDCTDAMIDGIRSTFDFYMSEKDQEYRPHYNSVMNAYFNEIGLGICAKDGQYYLTVHYGTKLL